MPLALQGETEVRSRGVIELQVDKLKQDVTPNLHGTKAEVDYTITVRNLGNQTEQYLITETNNHAFFVIISPTTTNNLEPDQSTLVTVTIQVDNNAPMTTFDYNTNVKVTANGNSSNFEAVTLKTRILQAYGVELQPLYTTTDTDENVKNNKRIVTFPIDIQNIGTGMDNFKLEISGNYSSWAKLNNSYFTIDSQAKAPFKVEVSIPRETGVGFYQFELSAISRGDDDLYDLDDAYDQVILTAEVTEFYDIQLDSDTTQKTALPGQVVGFNITVMNLGNTFDDVELRIANYDLDWDWWLSDYTPKLSPAGDTQGGDLKVIQLTNTVPTDVHGMNGTYNISIYAYSTDTPSGKVLQNDGKPLVFSVIVGKVYGVDLILDNPLTMVEQQIDPGEILIYELRLVNKGNTVDKIRIRAQGEKAGWVTLPENIYIIEPFENLQFNITLSIPNLTDKNLEEIEADRYLITIKATSENNPDTSAEVDLTPQVNKIYKTELASDLTLDATGKGLVITDPNDDPEYTRFTLTVTNKGNIVDKITLTSVEINDWMVEFKTSITTSTTIILSLAIGRSETVTVQVYAPSDAENGESQTLSINARSENGLVTSNLKIRATVETAVIIFKSLKVSDTSSGTTTIKLIVANNGDVAAEDVEVRFVDNNVYIGEVNIERIEKNDEVEVTFTYELEAGDHDIEARTEWSDNTVKKNTAFTTEYEGIYSGLYFVLIIVIVIVVILVTMLLTVARHRAEQVAKEKQEAHREESPEKVSIEKEVTKPDLKLPPKKLEPLE